MKQVPLAEVPGVLGEAFSAGDAASLIKAQERANVERMAQMFHLIAAGRFEELREHLAPDATLEIVAPESVPWVRHAEGADDVAAAIAANFGTVGEQRPEPLALVAQGDTVMVMARETGRWAATGEPYHVLLAQQYTFRDGRLAVFRSVAGTPAAADRA